MAAMPSAAPSSSAPRIRATSSTGRVKLGVGNGSSVRAQAGISGPMGDIFKYRARVSYYDTDGYLPSTYLGEQGRPVQSLSGRVRLSFEPSETFSATCGCRTRTSTHAASTS